MTVSFAAVDISAGPEDVMSAAKILANTYSGSQGDQQAAQADDQQPLQLTAIKTTQSKMTSQKPQAAETVSGDQQYDPQHLFAKPDVNNQEAFNSLTSQSMPMTPDQIRRLKQMLAVTQMASASPVGTPPKPTLSTQMVSLAPGAVPPVIRLQQGFVTSIVFVDDTGADWPIDSYDLGNSQAFNVQWEANSNTMMIQAMSMYTYGNLAVKLKGLSTPVMLTLVPGQQIVDYRVDLRIQKTGPNANPIITIQQPGAANDLLLGVLDGVAPQGAKILNVSGGDCQAWSYQHKMYVRTRLNVLSPSWIGKMTSPDGTNAYVMEESPTLLVSKNGQPVELNIEID